MTPTAFSKKFGEVVRKLNLCDVETGKPAPIRLYNLRKYFRNNLRMDRDYKEFLMGHQSTLGVDTHYISRDRELYRELYAKGYPDLRIYSPESTETSEEVQKLKQQLSQKDHDIDALSKKVDRLTLIMTRLVEGKDDMAYQHAFGMIESENIELRSVVRDLEARLDKLEGKKTMEESIAEKDTPARRRAALKKHRELKAKRFEGKYA